MLPRDVSRCYGKQYDDTARPLPSIKPAMECIDCQRRTDNSAAAFPIGVMGAPDEYPCPQRIAPQGGKT